MSRCPEGQRLIEFMRMPAHFMCEAHFMMKSFHARSAFHFLRRSYVQQYSCRLIYGVRCQYRQSLRYRQGQSRPHQSAIAKRNQHRCQYPRGKLRAKQGRLHIQTANRAQGML